MTRGGILLSSRKYLAWIAMGLFTILVLLSPRAYAADSGGGRACDDNSRPMPYTNGAPIVRNFYPADGSTVTVTSTGAVIKQSPCQSPYREGWVNPANICKLNTFDDLGGMINKADNNPNPNADPVYSCVTSAPPASTMTTPAAAPVRPNDVTVVQTVNNPPAPVNPTPAPVVASASTTTPATALPDTGAGGIVALGGISTVVGTVGHFFYRRRAAN